ncbi:MAG TPA: hypothetical protein VKX39_17600 [Bryobacteraceae bacterium]|jgi:hypothetical protein|nr:hypothetical protein [Bryobacteraceae bacterium]
MRLTLLFLALAGAALASTPAQTATYIDGNVTGISPNTGGTLSFDDGKAMMLRTGLTSVAVPYDAVSHAELGAVKEDAHGKPFYKFWSRKHKIETQLLIVNFKDEQGADRTMTLELEQPAAQTVLDDLEARTGKQFTASQTSARKKSNPVAGGASVSKNGEWWGDQYWKTPRNADKWSKPSEPNNDQH